ncbi:MAG: hypothetical protein AAB091_06770 [Elusimicrobiota bacterium]
MAKKLAVTSQIEFIVLKEGNKFVAYAPALDMSTCGDTFEQVQKRASELVTIFVEETIRHGTFEQALQELGWEQGKKRGEPTWIPPHIIGQTTQPIKIPLHA